MSSLDLRNSCWFFIVTMFILILIILFSKSLSRKAFLIFLIVSKCSLLDYILWIFRLIFRQLYCQSLFQNSKSSATWYYTWSNRRGCPVFHMKGNLNPFKLSLIECRFLWIYSNFFFRSSMIVVGFFFVNVIIPAKLSFLISMRASNSFPIVGLVKLFVS